MKPEIQNKINSY